MAHGDTSIGGPREGFHTTAWSMILAYQKGNEIDRQEAITQLIEQYWKPVYYYIRLQWGHTNEDSKDLAQQFFAHLLEAQTLTQVARSRGRFRAFLKATLKNYLTNDYWHGRALKRGGGKQVVSLQQLQEADRTPRAPTKTPNRHSTRSGDAP